MNLAARGASRRPQGHRDGSHASRSRCSIAGLPDPGHRVCLAVVRFLRRHAPVLIVHHRNDECFATPYYNVGKLKRRFTSSGLVEDMIFEGGDPPISGPCKAQSAHGFLGIENRVVDAIARWIKRARPE